LRLGQGRADQGHLPFGNLESRSNRFGNPQTSTGPNVIPNTQLFGFSSIQVVVFQTSADIRIIAKSTNLSK
jgi:hypothetical protein